MEERLIYFESEAREKLINGVNKLSRAVISTLGAKGRTVILRPNINGKPYLTKDGISVARQVFLDDEVEDIGAQILKEVSSKLNEEVGDGTSSSLVLAHAIINFGNELISTGEITSSEFKSKLEVALNKVLGYLSEEVKEIKTKEDLLNVALISANGDEDTAKVASDAIWSVGNAGVVNVSRSTKMNTEVETYKGIHFDNGYMSPAFVNNSEESSVELHHPRIVLCDADAITIQEVGQVANIYNEDKTRPLLVIIPRMLDEGIKHLSILKNIGGPGVCVVKAPNFGEIMQDMLVDMSYILGCKVISKDQGQNLTSLNPEIHVGTAIKAVINNRNTTIIGGVLDDTSIEQKIRKDHYLPLIKSRYKQIGNKFNEETESDRKQVLQERLSFFTSGVVDIKVGGASEVSMIEKKDRMDDAVSACKAAIQEGFVTGGGNTLLKISNYLDNPKMNSTDMVMIQALQAPFKAILANGGITEISDIYKEIHQSNFEKVYNVRTNKFENVEDNNIIDAAKVTRLSLETAVDIASLVLTSSAVISDKKKSI